MTATVLMQFGRTAPRLVPAAAASIPLSDRGFLYGDGLFETIRLLDGATPWLPLHVRRLRTGASLLRFAPLPWSDADLAARIEEVVTANGLRDGYVRLTVTRGPSARGYEPPPEAEPLLVVQAGPWQPPPGLYERGYRATVASTRVIAGSPLTQVKSLNALDKVLARAEARDRGCDEALLLNTYGNVAEGAATSVFIVRGREVVTPRLECGALPGIGRHLALRALRELGYTCSEAPVSLADLQSADEVFVTNALVLAVDVVALDGEPVGRYNGPGPAAAAVRERIMQDATGGTSVIPDARIDRDVHQV